MVTAIWRRPVRRPLEERRVELAERIGRDIAAYLEGGPDLGAEHVASIEGFAEELEPKDIEGLKEQTRELWKQAKIQVGVRPKPANEEEGPQIDAGLKVSAKPEAKPAPKVTLPAVVPFKPPSADRVSYADAIVAMNEQHAIIENFGNKTVIASWETSPLDLNQPKLAFHSKESFLLRYSNRTVMVERPDGRGGYRVQPEALGHWWLNHRDRRQHRGVVFRPGDEKVVSDHLNLWQGWGVMPKAGDWSLIKRHIEEVIAGGNAEFADYVVRWIAWSLQNPAAQAEVALVLIGAKGTGKGTLARALRKIFGAHAFQVTSREEVIGKFNGHLQDCVLFVADEAYWGGDKRCVGRLQGIITEPTLPIERKGFDLISVPNYLHVLMLAEPGWVIPAGRHERRFAAFAISDVYRGDRPYFKALYGQIEGDGAAAMMWDLVRMELDGWHPRDLPEGLLKSGALQEQQSLTLPPIEQWYLSLLQDGRLPGALVYPPTTRKKCRPSTAYTKSLRDDAMERYQRLRYELTDNAIGFFLTDKAWPKAVKYRDNTTNGWTFLPLAESRQEFEKRYGQQEWNDLEEWDATPKGGF